MSVSRAQQPTVHGKGILGRDQLPSQHVRGRELPTSHCMIVAVAKGSDRAHGMTTKRKPCRLPLTWSMLFQGKRVVTAIADEGRVMCLGLAFNIVVFPLCRASELWVYANWQVHPEFCLIRSSVTFSGETHSSRSNIVRPRTRGTGAVCGLQE